MKKEKKIINGIPVTYIKTDKFKTIIGSLYFKMPYDKEKNASNYMLGEVLTYSCKKYNTKEKLSFEWLKNCSTSYSVVTSRVGNHFINYISFNCINDKYIDEEVVMKAVDTYNEMIFNPNVIDGEFEEKSYSLLYDKYKTSLERKKERQKEYGDEQLMTLMDEDANYSSFATVKKLEKLTRKNLYDEYINMINNSEVELVLVGDYDFDDIADIITKKLKNNKCACTDEDKMVVKKDIAFKEEKINTNGSIFFLGMKCIGLTSFEKLYVAPLYSVILGGGAASRLFQIVREQNSLAYYCYSRYNKYDQIIKIVAGIDGVNYEKTRKLVLEIIDSMNEIKEEELNRAKAEIISALKETEDSIGMLPNTHYYGELNNQPDTEERIKLYNKVTIEDIIGLYNKIHADSIFLLKSDKEANDE